MSKYVDNSEHINYDGIRTYIRIVRGGSKDNDRERKGVN